MDGQTKFLKVAELKREMHADDCSDERAIAIMAEIRKIEAKPKSARKPKKEREQYMTVLDCYVLDMHQHGLLVGHRNESGQVVCRHTGKVIS